MIIGNIAIFLTILQVDNILKGDWSAIKIGLWVLPGSIAIIFSGIINAQIKSEMKARLVFWRWKNPLPGSQAFSRYAMNDQRISLQLLQQNYGPLPTDPKEQNALWYRLYKSVSGDVSVIYAHGEFLFNRDYAFLSLVFLFFFGIVGWFLIVPIKTKWIYIAFLIIQVCLTNNAARNHGQRFVTTVMAIKSAEK